MKKAEDSLGTVEITRKVGISAERLRYWEKMGIVKPILIQHGTRKFRRYSEEDIRRAVFVKSLVDHDKYTLEGALRRLQEGGGLIPGATPFPAWGSTGG
jgi:DNA-binding transcriptional MerR regulator